MTGSISSIGSALAPAIAMPVATPTATQPTAFKPGNSQLLDLALLTLLLDLIVDNGKHTHHHACQQYQAALNLTNAAPTQTTVG